MGSAQSKRRPIMPTFSDYNRLPSSSPLNEKLLMEDSDQDGNLCEHCEAIVKDIFKKYIASEKKIAEAERKTGLVSQNAVLEESLKQNTTTLAKFAYLEEKVVSLLLRTAVLLEHKIKENAADVEKLAELEKKYELVQQLLLSKNIEPREVSENYKQKLMDWNSCLCRMAWKKP